MVKPTFHPFKSHRTSVSCRLRAPPPPPPPPPPPLLLLLLLLLPILLFPPLLPLPLLRRLLLLLLKRHNLNKVLACSTTFSQLSPIYATFSQLVMFILFISSKTSSSQRVLGLPIGLLDRGFHLLIFCARFNSKTYVAFNLRCAKRV